MIKRKESEENRKRERMREDESAIRYGSLIMRVTSPNLLHSNGHFLIRHLLVVFIRP